MAAASLLLSATLGLIASASFATVGVRLGRRRPPDDLGRANLAFRTWWFAAAGYAFLTGFLLNALASMDLASLAVVLAGRQLSVAILAIGLGGLLHYTTFVWTGWSRGRLAGWVLAGAIYALVLAAYASASAASVRIGPFETRIEWAPAPPPALAAAAFAALTLPELAASIAILALAPRLEPAARRRALLVGASLAAWFGASILAAVRVDDPVILARPLLGIVAALCVLVAYAPPRAIETWSAGAEERRSATAARVRQLI